MGIKMKRAGRLTAWLMLVIAVTAGVAVFDTWWQHRGTQAIEAMSWVVAGRTFIVDPGHGGEDPGKVSPGGIYEKDINLAVAKKLSAVLNQGGGQVILTREKDQALSNNENTIRERKRSDLAKRWELAAEAKADIFISLHCNSFPQGRWFGAQTFYSPAVPGSKELASYIQEEMTAFLGNTTRRAKPDNVSLILKKATIPIVNIEMGFLSNPQEERLLQDPAYQDKIAWSVYAGVVRFLVEYGDQYKPTMNYHGK